MTSRFHSHRRDLCSHPTIVIPSTQKNGRNQEIAMLPGLRELLGSVSLKDRIGWIANPLPIEYEIKSDNDWFRPTDDDLKVLTAQYSNRSIAGACGVSDTAVRKWLSECRIRRDVEFQSNTGTIMSSDIRSIRRRATTHHSHGARRTLSRLTKERVGRITAMIGKEAGIIVQQQTIGLVKR